MTGGIERELKNESIHDTSDALGVIEDDLNRLAEGTGAEYVSIRIEPLTKDQHEANEALRQLVASRSETEEGSDR